jgi:hypothetical protein
MAEKDVMDKLAKLTPREREVLIMICAGNAYKTIAKTFFIGVTTVKTHMGRIYVKLGLNYIEDRSMRLKAIFETYCQAMHEANLPVIVEEPVESESESDKESEPEVEPEPEPEPEPVPQNVQLMVIEDEKAITAYRRGEIIYINPEKGVDPVRRRTINPLTLIVVLIVLGLAAFGVFAIIQSLTKRTSPTEIIQPTLQQDIVVSPTQIAVIPANTEVIPTNTAVIPTLTPSPQPTAIPKSGVLFEDNFDTGLSPLWEVVSGEPIIVNGKLAASQDTWIVVGDPNWTNYSVEYVADSFFNYLNFDYNVTAVRVMDMGNMYAAEWSSSQIVWLKVENGQWNEIPESNTKMDGARVNSHRITVNKNIITVFVNGIQKFYFVDSKYTHGRIGIMIHEGTQIDNFKVRAILD